MRIKQLFLVASLATGVALAADRPSFTGMWTLDAAQSTGDVPSWSSISIGQSSRWFRMAKVDAKVDKDGRAIRNVEEECRIDGRFHPVDGGQGGSISCRWDGTTLVTEKHWNNDQDRRSIRTTFAADGKLVQDIEQSGPAGTKEAHIVWIHQ